MKALERLLAETAATYEDMAHELQLRLVDELRAQGFDEDEIDHAILRLEADIEERLEAETLKLLKPETRH